MGVVRIDHVGIAVKSVESVSPAIRNLFTPPPAEVEEVEDQGVRAVSYRAGEGSIEFLESLDESSPVGRYLAQRGSGIHHIALEVDDLETTLADLKREGVVLIDEKPRAGAGGKRIAFIHPKSAGGILIELCDRPA